MSGTGFTLLVIDDEPGMLSFVERFGRSLERLEPSESKSAARV